MLKNIPREFDFSVVDPWVHGYVVVGAQLIELQSLEVEILNAMVYNKMVL